MYADGGINPYMCCDEGGPTAVSCKCTIAGAAFLVIPKQQKRTWIQYAFTHRLHVKEQLLTMLTIPRHKCPTHPQDNHSHLLLSLHNKQGQNSPFLCLTTEDVLQPDTNV